MAKSNVQIEGYDEGRRPGKGDLDVGGLAIKPEVQNFRIVSPEEVKPLESLPIFNESKISMNREVYSKKKFNEVINNEFEELLRQEDTFTNEQFFKLYDNLFFDIPKLGLFSHQSLRDRSSEFLGEFNLTDENNIIDNLNNKILELEEALLLANQVTPEHPFYKNNTLVRQLDSDRVFYLDKGFKRLVDSADSSWYNALRDLLGVEGSPLQAPSTALAQIPSPNSPARNLTRANQHLQTVIQNNDLIFYSDSDNFAGVTTDEQVAELEVIIQNLQNQVIDGNERQAIADNIVGDVKSFAADTLRRIPIPIPFTNKNIYDDIGAVRDFVEEQAQKLRGYILNELERFIG